MVRRALDLRRPAPADLPENHRQVLTLSYFEERSYEEAARMLGLPMGTVKIWLHRAKKQVAAAMGPGKPDRA
jgi:RNA polymerase sigma-70 factor (ECF subfamily)